ncbi:Syntaxin-binding protein 5-like [Linum perenne]
MFTKLFHKNADPADQSPSSSQENASKGSLSSRDIYPRVNLHYGIPSTASVMAFDPIQSLLALGTLDGRIKVIGGDNIEGLMVSPKQLPFKYLEFLQNQGFLVSVSSENEIQVWDLEHRRITSSLRWESSITAFSAIHGSSYMYVGDEYGMVYVLKYNAEDSSLVPLPYYVPTSAIDEASGGPSSDQHSVVGVLPQPSSRGNRLHNSPSFRRVLIAYDNGLLILWDVSEDKVIVVKGNKDLQLKSKIAVNSQEEVRQEPSDDEQLDKEISALCWTSGSGTVLAVGYVDGDIMLWKLSTSVPSKDNNVVKLQLSSDDRRLPVIVLHWYPKKSRDDCGQLFVYGGDAIGSEEVLTILNLDWSAGIGNLKCIGRTDITLSGSFADMVLLTRGASVEASGILVLTNPGQLHFYDSTCLSLLMSKEQKSTVSPIEYPMAIPTVEPSMTAGKLGLICKDGNLSRVLSEEISSAKLRSLNNSGNTNWPLTGGIPSEFLAAEDYQVERIYIAGYQDGSVRIFDATCPTFSFFCVLGPEVKGTSIAGASASVSALDFCPFTLTLAIGNELGKVLLYSLTRSTDATQLNFVTESGKEVHTLQGKDEPHCTAVFSFHTSPISTLQFVNSGSRLAVGFHSGRVALLDINTSSVLFLTDSLSRSGSPIKSLEMRPFPETASVIPVESGSICMENNTNCEVFVVTKDGQFVLIDGNTGNIVFSQLLKPEEELIVVSTYVIGSRNRTSCSSEDRDAERNSVQSTTPDGFLNPVKADLQASSGAAGYEKTAESFLLLLCSENALYLYSINSLKEGDSHPVERVNFSKPCGYARTFKKGDKDVGLVVIYQTGEIDVRSFPNFELVGESSLMSILRWNFKSNMEKTICSSQNGQIILVNGCEVSSISLLAFENDLRIPDSLSVLHDKVLEAAIDATENLSPNKKDKQGSLPGIIGGILKGFHGGKEEEQKVSFPEVGKSNLAHLDAIFSYPPYLKPSLDFADDANDVVELSIDDINLDFDEHVVVTSTTERKNNDEKDKGKEREKLFEGGTTDSKPTMRTVEEIKKKYGKEDAAGAAALARDKLAERGEKLERLSLRTEELQNGAENFASLAQELAKRMEKRKWWQL